MLPSPIVGLYPFSLQLSGYLSFCNRQQAHSNGRLYIAEVAGVGPGAVAEYSMSGGAAARTVATFPVPFASSDLCFAEGKFYD